MASVVSAGEPCRNSVTSQQAGLLSGLGELLARMMGVNGAPDSRDSSSSGKPGLVQRTPQQRSKGRGAQGAP